MKRGQPACIWIGVRVRSGRLQSPVLEHRAGSASGWALACGGSCSYSRSEASCFSYSSSVKKKEVSLKRGQDTERGVWGGVLRFGDNHSEHGQSNEAMNSLSTLDLDG